MCACCSLESCSLALVEFEVEFQFLAGKLSVAAGALSPRSSRSDRLTGGLSYCYYVVHKITVLLPVCLLCWAGDSEDLLHDILLFCQRTSRFVFIYRDRRSLSRAVVSDADVINCTSL